MSFETTRRDIEKRLSDNWATTPIAFDNVDFKPENGSRWIRLRLLDGDVIRINIGEPGLFRHTGLISIELFGPTGEGSKTLRGYADTLASLFRDTNFNGITTREASITNVGESGGWYQINLTVPYYVDAVY